MKSDRAIGLAKLPLDGHASGTALCCPVQGGGKAHCTALRLTKLWGCEKETKVERGGERKKGKKGNGTGVKERR